MSTRPNLQTNVWKITKINWMSSSQATSFKLGEYNLLYSISTLRFKNCVNSNLVAVAVVVVVVVVVIVAVVVVVVVVIVVAVAATLFKEGNT